MFDNILSRRVQWFEDQVEISPDARDFIERLLCMDPESRLGANGAEEVKAHPFLNGIDWDNLLSKDAIFVPRVTDPENTDYFDARGAQDQVFEDEDAAAEEPSPSHEQPPRVHDAQESIGHLLKPGSALAKMATEPPEALGAATHHHPTGGAGLHTSQSSSFVDDFGTFSFKNVEVLKQANQDLIKKLRSEQGQVVESSPNSKTNLYSRHHPTRSGSLSLKVSTKVLIRSDRLLTLVQIGPTSPTESSTSSSSMPSYGSLLGPGSSGGHHARRPSEQPHLTRLRSPTLQNEPTYGRRNSLPTKWRSVSASATDRSGPLQDTSRRASTVTIESTPPSSTGSPNISRTALPKESATSAPVAGNSSRTVDVLVAEDNPISSKVLETILTRLGCRCVVVHNGEEVMRCTMGELVFDVIFVCSF